MKGYFWLWLGFVLACAGCANDTSKEHRGTQKQAVGPAVTTSLAPLTGTSLYFDNVDFTYTITGSGNPPFGQVDLVDTSNGDAVEGTQYVNSETSTYTFSVYDLAPGEHRLEARFAGDQKNGYPSNVSNSVDHTVYYPTALDVTVSAPNDATRTTFIYGEPFRVQAHVYPNRIVTAAVTNGNQQVGPNGKIAIRYGKSLDLGTCDVANGMADCQVTGVPVGPRQTIIASFTPNPGDYNGPSSNVSNVFAVTQAQSVAQIAGATPEPSVVGAAVDFSIHVSPVAPSTLPPAGIIHFFRDGTPTELGTATLVPGVGFSTATFTVSSGAIVSSAGQKFVHADYESDGNFAASTTATYTHVVTLDATQRTLTASPASPWSFEAPITFTATINAQNAASGTPTGSVSFYDGASITPTAFLGNDTLHAGPGGQIAKIVTSSLALGGHTITAVYSGDASHASGTFSLSGTVVKATPTVALVVNPGSAVYSQPVTFGAQVTGATTAPTGTVQFFVDGSTPIGGPISLTSGFASLTSSSVTVGDNRPITAVYSGDTHYNTASGAGTLTVGLEPTSTTISSSSNPSVAGTNVTFTATVIKVGNATFVPQGVVTFSDGATVLGSASVDGGGVAKLTTSALSASTHTITATFAGAANFGGSSDSLEQSVSVDGVTTTLVSSANPSTVGDNVTFTATFGSGAGGTATGTALFFDGSTSLGSAPLSGGSASISTATLSAGLHTIKVTYAGDATHAASTGTLSQNVVRLPSTTTLTTTAGASTPLGAPVPLTATVTGAGGTVTGTVSFKDGATVLGTVAVDATGVASYTAVGLGVGSHALSATFTGDPMHLPSESATLSHTVDKAPTTVTVVSSLSPAPVGFNIVFSANVTSTTGAAFAPTGTVSFSDGATTIGSGTINGSGVAQFSIATLGAGTHSITATYAGDPHFGGATSAAFSQVVSATASAITLTSAPNPSALGASVTLTVSVSGGAAVPTGSVTFKNGATTLATAALDGTGKATFATAALPAGILSLAVDYAGDATHDPGTATTSHVVQKGVTTTTLSASTSTAAPGATITFTANVASTAGSVAGTVELFDATTSIGTATIAGGTATFSIATLTAGQHAITAQYKGSDTFATSISNSVIVTIGAGANTDAGADGGGTNGSSGGGSSSGSTPPPGANGADGGAVNASGGLNLTPGNGGSGGDDCAVTAPGSSGTAPLTAPLLLGLIAVLARRRRKVAA